MAANDFVRKTRGSFEFLTCRALDTAGIEHGFIGKSADFSGRGLKDSSLRFLDEFNVSKIILLEQVHGKTLVTYDWRSDSGVPEADAIFIPRKKTSRRQGIAFGIRVADCLSLFFVSQTAITLVHAGWRGLAQGIHLLALDSMREQGTSKEGIQAVLWPCAGLNSYEVGGEVIENFHDAAVSEPRANGKFLFGLRETAKRAFCKAGLACGQSYISEECTISDTSFHSYRREAEKSGRNLAFVIL